MAKTTPGFFGSIFGVLIGIGLVVLVSPLLAWSSQSQDRAKEFKKGEVVASETITEGYVIVEGDTAATDKIYCPKMDDETINIEGLSEEGRDLCAYVEVREETFMYVEKEVCGDIDDDQILIEHTEDDCFLVEELEWTQTDKNEIGASFKIGAYSILVDDAILIDDESFTDYVGSVNEETAYDGDIRYKVTYLPLKSRMLVAGNSESNGVIEDAFDGKPFVISTKGYEGTLDALKTIDRNSAIGLAVFSLITMVLGMILIVGPLTYLTNVLHVVPIVGKHVDKGFDLVVKMFAALVGVVIWLVMFAIVVVIKKLLIAIIVLGVLGVIVFFLVEKGKIKLKKEHKDSVQQ